jgi:hypothetical protein
MRQSAHKIAVPAKGRNQLVDRFRRIGYGGEKSVLISASEYHALMFVQHTTRALIGEIAGGQT